MRKFVVILSVVITVIFAWAVVAAAATNNLPDCSQTTVNNAISGASTGDVLVCPAGSWSWSSMSINKNITLQGAGIGNTNITCTSNPTVTSPSSYTGAFRITGFTFTSPSGSNLAQGLINISGPTGSSATVKTGWRIDHNQIRIWSNQDASGGPSGIRTLGAVGGLIDHNEFTDAPGSSGCIHASVYPGGNSHTDWTMPSQLTAGIDPVRTIFVEDNLFDENNVCSSHGSHVIYGQFGGFYVLRHNTINNQNADSHGFCHTQATREWEISNNIWGQGVDTYSMIHPRGGTGVIYGNTLASGTYRNGIWWEEYRIHRPQDCGSTSSNATYNLPGYGIIHGSDPCLTTEGYPCAQMVGRGQNSTEDPVYVWNNTNFPGMKNSNSAYILDSRDYYLDQGAKPGYVSYTYPHPLQGGEPLPPPPPPPPPPGNQIPNPPSSIIVISGGDTTAPMLGTHTPASGEPGWPVTNWFVDFDITDDVGIDETSLLFRANNFSDHSCGDAYVTCSWNIVPTSLHVRYTYTRDWEPNQTHTLNILQINDTSGNRLATSWSFSTGP